VPSADFRQDGKAIPPVAHAPVPCGSVTCRIASAASSRCAQKFKLVALSASSLWGATRRESSERMDGPALAGRRRADF
jgi:hypothetical protein